MDDLSSEVAELFASHQTFPDLWSAVEEHSHTEKLAHRLRVRDYSREKRGTPVQDGEVHRAPVKCSCGKVFVPKHAPKGEKAPKHCSPACRFKSAPSKQRAPKEPIQCHCGVVFLPKPNAPRTVKSCSKKCSRKAA